jgi:hypothetical protein
MPINPPSTRRLRALLPEQEPVDIAPRSPTDTQVRKATTFEAIVMSRPFAEGVADRRAGRRPQFDRPETCGHNAWWYEYGWLFGCLAPVGMPVRNGRGWANPAAVALFRAAVRKGFIP